MMLSKSDDANVINFKLRSVLHVAVYEESLRCVELLLKHSANVNAQVELQLLTAYSLLTYCLFLQCQKKIGGGGIF